MQTRSLLFVLVILAGFGGTASAQEPSAAKRYAVLVGIKEYDHQNLTPLRYPTNDVTVLRDVLAQSGYQVTLMTVDAGKQDPKLRPTKANIEAQLKRVLDGAGNGDLVLVALAGHGLQFEGVKDSYFCPIDGKPFLKQKDTLVSMSRIYDDMKESLASMKLLLVDACRDDPAAGRGIDDNAPKPPSGVVALFSCRAGERAFEHDKYKHGVFFHYVLQGLRGEAANKKGRVTFNGLATYVMAEVPEDVPTLKEGAKQSPNLKGDFSNDPTLVTVKTDAVTSKTPPGTAPTTVTAEFQAYMRSVLINQGVRFLKREAPAKFEGWRKAADAGSADAALLLGDCLFEGVGTAKDEEEAVKWYRKAAEQGHPNGMFSLGQCYRIGTGITKDHSEGDTWLRKAADAGDPTALDYIGQMYYLAEEAERDDKEAVKWFRKAAEVGSANGMINLGHCYIEGRGVEEDKAEAVKWYRKAADTGCNDGVCVLANCYLDGVETDALTGMAVLAKDEAEALRLFRKTAQAGHAPGMNMVGRIYYEGWGVDKDLEESCKWFRRAADAGDAQGMYNLGAAYAKGEGVEKDAAEAVRWYRKAADAGDTDAMVSLGTAYYEGEGVGQDDAEALKWYRKAAEANDAGGMYCVGRCYEDGRGVAVDKKEAIRWYQKSADAGDEDAKEALKRLEVPPKEEPAERRRR